MIFGFFYNFFLPSQKKNMSIYNNYRWTVFDYNSKVVYSCKIISWEDASEEVWMSKCYAKYGFFFLFRDYLVVWATIMGNECFMICELTCRHFSLLNLASLRFIIIKIEDRSLFPSCLVTYLSFLASVGSN